MSTEHLHWLLEQAAGNARTFLDAWEKLKRAEPDSDEHVTREGEVLVWLMQVKFDAEDVHAENDRWLDSLPDDDLPEDEGENAHASH